jgi:hypothetical protein
LKKDYRGLKMDPEIKIKFSHVLAVWIAEWIKKVCFEKWNKEWQEMSDIQRKRYFYILKNYDGLLKKK